MTTLKGFSGLAAALVATEATKGALRPVSGKPNFPGSPENSKGKRKGKFPGSPEHSGKSQTGPGYYVKSRLGQYAEVVFLPPDMPEVSDDLAHEMEELDTDQRIQTLLDAQANWLNGIRPHVNGPMPQKTRWEPPKLKPHQTPKLAWNGGRREVDPPPMGRNPGPLPSGLSLPGRYTVTADDRLGTREEFIATMALANPDVIYL